MSPTKIPEVIEMSFFGCGLIGALGTMYCVGAWIPSPWEGSLQGVLLGNVQTCMWSIFSALFTRGRSRAASGYQSSAADCCQCWCRDTLSNSDRRKPPLLPQTLPNCARMFVALITSLGRPVRAPGRNAPLIRFLISALYVLLARLMFILCASPPLVFYIYFVL